MKSKFLNIFIFIFLVFSLVGCGGEMGPQGPQGEQGIQGIQGEQGQPGKDGNTPAITIGQNGNWYIDGVDTGVSAKGESGQNGEQGPRGEQGQPGKEGEVGLSAYEIFLKYYPEYEGTEQEWITDVAMGNKCNLFGHEWDEGVVTTEPTKGNDGEKTYSCKNCDEHKYEVLPMLEVFSGEIYEVNGIKYVNFGSYPQAHVGDESLILELNKLNETNARGYYEYNGSEYTKITSTPYNYGSYIDDYGNVQYYKYNDGKEICGYVVEWFKVEPIKWRIISENSDGSYQIYSEYILDVISFCDYDYVRNINGNDVYQNNYKYSNIRAWLNGYDGTNYSVANYTGQGFYDLAFNDSEKYVFLTTEVDNSSESTSSSGNIYACENTFDKVYLLSDQDLQNRAYMFSGPDSRMSKVTDYSKAVGVKWDTSIETINNGYYWMRTPFFINSKLVYVVGSDGKVINSNFVNNQCYGIRVACTINLENN